MFLSNFQRRALKVLLFIILLGLPFFTNIYYTVLYYIMVIIGIVLQLMMKNESLEERFYQRWSKTRHKGIWYNVFREALKNFRIMMVVVLVGQLFGNGYTPIYIIQKLSLKQGISIIVLAVIISFGVGLVSWFENEKRYQLICWRKENLENDI